MNILDYKPLSTEIPNGSVITKFVNDYIDKFKCENILFVRTPTTGAWLDNIGTNNNNIVRIAYDTQFVTKFYSFSIKNKIKYENLETELNKLNKKFDLICMDTFHEYETSKRDFHLLYSYLSEKGTLVSHDCFPETIEIARPKYQRGSWCGVTYISFVEFAYNHPELYYCVLNIDTGIGIVSKTNNISFLKSNLNLEKQKIFLTMYKANIYTTVYKYFYENSDELINGKQLYS